MTTCGIVVGTFGDSEWADRGREVAARYFSQADQIVHCHANDLATARNHGAAQLETDYVVFLDADDGLESDYVEQFKSCVSPEKDLLYQPLTSYVTSDGWSQPEFLESHDINVYNCLVIGTVCPRETFLSLGGFDKKLPALEDFDLWLRFLHRGFVVRKVPAMVYNITVRDGRNSNKANARKALRMIKQRYRHLPRLGEFREYAV